MRIDNGLVFGQNNKIARATILIDGDRIAALWGGNFSPGDRDYIQDRKIDAREYYVLPGLIDLHFHGCAGADFCDGTVEAIETMARYELEHGITAICPATMSYDEETLAKIMRAAAEFDRKQKLRTGAVSEKCTQFSAESVSKRRATTAKNKATTAGIKTTTAETKPMSRLVGIHLEGPFLSEEKAGAQKTEYLCDPDVSLVRRLNQLSGGLIKIVDVAPERDGAIDFIMQLKEEVRISLSHTNADYATAINAFWNGARHVTHLYNAMPPFHHREPGLIGAASAYDDRITVELICDGIHVSDSVLGTTFKLFRRDNIVMISDSMRACGMPDGEYELGGQKVMKTGREARLADGTIAGSVCNMLDMVQELYYEVGLPLEDIICAASFIPAKVLGIEDDYGSIQKGKKADLILLNKKLELVMVIQDGKIVVDRREKQREKR